MASQWPNPGMFTFRLLLLLVFTLQIKSANAIAKKGPSPSSSSVKQKPLVPALIVFGDSTVDPGNNNHLSTSLKSNFPPYGRDFDSRKPTGRFTNGKLVTDFLAAELGIKDTIPAYLSPGLTNYDLFTGVSFASAGTGFDNRTARLFSVISVWKEMEYFKDYVATLSRIGGADRAQSTVEQAIFVVSMGSNDFLENYYINPYSRLSYNLSGFQDHLLQIAFAFLQELYNYGARRIALAGLPPLGCLPIERTVNLRIFNRGTNCIETLNQHALSYNAKLQKMMESMKTGFPDLKIAYADVYSPLIDMENHPAKYGFQVTGRACCGTGLVEFGLTCNSRTPFTCSDASKYMFWDAFHPTQSVYKIVAHHLLISCIPKLL